MNTLKSLFIVVILGAIAYGAYVSITRRQQFSTPQEDAPLFLGTSPGVSPDAAQPQFPAGRNTATAPSGLEAAPRFTPGIPAGGGAATGTTLPPTSRDGSTAPRFTPPQSTAGAGTAPPNVAVSPYGPYGSPAMSGQDLPQQSPTGPGSPATRVDNPAVSAIRGVNPLPGRGLQADSADKYTALIDTARTQIDEGRFAETHLTLSKLHDDRNIPPAQAGQIKELLDQLAGYVIYSRQHLLETPHTVKPGETLQQIGSDCNVPWQLLANINGIRDLQQPLSGRQLKLVRGPFNAVVNLSEHKLTLMLAGRYAGTFGIGVGRDCPNLEGTYVVISKAVNPQYYGPGGEQIDADDPANPLGELSIGLGESAGRPSRISIHGTNDPTSLHTTSGRGSIRLADRDISDVYGILSLQPIPSKVTILR